MNLLLELFLRKKFVGKNADALRSAMQHANGGGAAEDIDALVGHYFCLLKAVYRGVKPTHVSVSDEAPYLLVVDGVPYDLDALIHHNDRRNTERKMQLDLLFSESIRSEEVEARLNRRLEAEW